MWRISGYGLPEQINDGKRSSRPLLDVYSKAHPHAKPSLKVALPESECSDCFAQPMISVVLGMAWVAAVLIIFAFVIRDR